MAKVKICGLKNFDNVQTAVENNADFLGFVFFEKSPRNIAIEEAAKLSQLARKINSKIQICAVTVNPNDELINELNFAFSPDYIQLHGGEDIKRIMDLKSKGIKIIKAFGVENYGDVENSKPYFKIADYVLFDAKPPKNSQNAGGFGISFDWEILNNLPKDLQWFLSGGLNPDNVKAAIAATNAINVDVSSGIESALGIKDNAKIAQFLQQAKD